MDVNQALGASLKELRLRKGLSQEAIGASQSYVSDVERGLKSLSFEKLDELANNIGVHPLTVLLNCYLKLETDCDRSSLIATVIRELEEAEIQKIT
jgi:transcriptional regulator with XRE-family HTH domain